MRRDKNNGITIGYASMIVVFMILVFVTFSILSYRHANSSLNRVNRSIEISKASYSADATAMEVKMVIDDILQNSETIMDAKNRIGKVIETINSYDNTIEYTIIINDKAKLAVKLEISESTKKTKITSWKIKTTNEEDYDQIGFNF